MHVIVMTVGVSIISKALQNSRLYQELMGSDNGSKIGHLTNCTIEDVENGCWPTRHGISTQQNVEKSCFEKSMQLPEDLSHEIERGKKNRFSAEVSSLYKIFNDKELDPNNCRIVLLTTDSTDGYFAARLNKRIIAHRLLKCDKKDVLNWNSEADNLLAPGLEQIPILRITDLQVTDAKRFKEGCKNLEKNICDQNQYLNPGDERILNITGGFKGVIPIAAAIAWRHGWMLAYLYEETNVNIIIEGDHWMREHPDKKNAAEMIQLSPAV